MQNYVNVEVNAQGRGFDSPPDTLADFVEAVASIVTVEKVNSDGDTVFVNLKYATLKSLRGKKGALRRDASKDLIRAVGEAGEVTEDELKAYGELRRS